MKLSIAFVAAVSVMAGGALGWVSHASSTVHAASDSGPVQFELQGTGPATQLGVYFANDKDLYIYQGVAAGSSSVNCSFKLHIARAGAPVERTNCGIGKTE